MKIPSLTLASIIGLQLFTSSYAEVCYTVKCDKLQGMCSVKSTLELKITLSDQCAKLEFCDVNNDYQGVCKSKNYYIDPVKLYPNDPCTEGSFKTTCAYGVQTCGENGYCTSVG